MKKEEHGFISDLDTLLFDYNTFSKEQFTGSVVPLLKKVLGTIFLMEGSFTFEELIDTINHFRNGCAAIEASMLALRQEEASLLDKKNKVKHDQNFIAKVKEIRSKIESMNKELYTCQKIAKVLETPRVEENFTRFCTRLSYLQFSDVPLERQAYAALFFNFLWIVNQFMFDFKETPKQGGFSKLFKSQKNYESYSLTELIDHSRKFLMDEDVGQATQAYAAILKQYRELDQISQARVYSDLFILWFEIHFYGQRKMEINTSSGKIS